MDKKLAFIIAGYEAQRRMMGRFVEERYFQSIWWGNKIVYLGLN